MKNTNIEKKEENKKTINIGYNNRNKKIIQYKWSINITKNVQFNAIHHPSNTSNSCRPLVFHIPWVVVLVDWAPVWQRLENVLQYAMCATAKDEQVAQQWEDDQTENYGI